MTIDLIQVFNDTNRLIDYVFAQDTREAIKHTNVYMGNLTAPESTELPVINYIASGTVNAGYKLCKKYKTAILNFADDVRAGGWVESGAPTQEEDICRCSNLLPTLLQDKCWKNYYEYNIQFKHFTSPMDKVRYEHCKGTGSNRVIYSSGIAIFKDDITYEHITARYLDVITNAAPSIYTDDLEFYTERITQIVLSAVHNKVESLVLGAWGCGAFGQPPKIIAKAFALVLNKYGGYFKNITFAMRHTSGSADSNYSIFSSILEQEYKGGIKYGL